MMEDWESSKNRTPSRSGIVEYWNNGKKANTPVLQQSLKRLRQGGAWTLFHIFEIGYNN